MHFFCRPDPVAITNVTCHISHVQYVMSQGCTLSPSDVPLTSQCLDCLWTNRRSNSRIFQNTTITCLSSINTTRWCICVFFLHSALCFLSPDLHSRVHPFFTSIHPSHPFLFKCVCLYFPHLWSLFSAGGGSSGSGNRSVRCHYSSNSVIRHLALPAHAACYGADTARAVRRLGRDSIWHAQRWARAGGVQGGTRVEMRSWVGWRQKGHRDKSG